MKGDPEELRAFWELWEHILPKLLVVCQRFFWGANFRTTSGKLELKRGIFCRRFPNFLGPENHQISPKEFATFPPKLFFPFFLSFSFSNL
jgi:hypothetical protein